MAKASKIAEVLVGRAGESPAHWDRDALDKERKLAPLGNRQAYLQRISDIVEGTREIPTDEGTS
jgi:hypothetical protein